MRCIRHVSILGISFYAHDILDALNAEELEPGLLYAVLTYRGELASWNWAFFVANPDVSPIGTSGTIFHVVNNDSVGEWKFEVESRDIISSPLVVAILRLQQYMA